MSTSQSSNELQNLTYANENFWLWPPIADAVQSFLRRRDDCEDYEKLWRLIHIWESISTTLSNVAVARFVGLSAETELRKCRENLYGQSYDKNLDQIKSDGQGAFDGSNYRRLEILNVVRKSSLNDSGVLNEIREFLSATQTGAEDANNRIALSTQIDEFSRAWGRVCDVPRSKSGASDYTVYECLQLINVFRNRFAHVPFPFDPLDALVNSLESLTELVFSVYPLPTKAKDGDRSSALTGCMMRKGDLWRGAQVRSNRNEQHDDLEFAFPANSPDERWAAQPFAFVDVSKRPYVLTRLVDAETESFEYTRFWAEGGAITTADISGGLKDIPSISEIEYREQSVAVQAGTAEVIEPATTDATDSAVVEVESVEAREVTTYDEAVTAIREQGYDAAIPFLRSYVEDRPEYHVGFQKLGYALREKAGRIASEAPYDNVDVRNRMRAEAVNMLHDSYDAFTKATEHPYMDYKASAFYDRSKTSVRLYDLTEDDEHAVNAWVDGNKAARTEDDRRFYTWIEYLDRRLPTEVTRQPTTSS